MAGQLIAVKLEEGSRTLCNHREKHKHMLREKPSVSQLIVSSNPALFYVTERACSDLSLSFDSSRYEKESTFKVFNRMDRKYINNINSFVAKRSAVRKCGNAYYAMQKEKFRFTFTANDKRQI